MKIIAKFAVKSVFGSIDPFRKDNSFEVKQSYKKVYKFFQIFYQIFKCLYLIN